jgi:hypothetical protein
MKNQAESGVRLRYGLVLAAFAVFLALGGGACNNGLDPVQDGQSAETQGSIIRDEDVVNGMVTVKIPLSGLEAANTRFLTEGDAKGLVDYYEIWFKDRAPAGGQTYYPGSAERGDGLLSVSVPINHEFDILLLAGYKKNRVLLASSFVNDDTNDTGVAGYVSGGNGFKIQAGRSNIINMTMTAITINPLNSANQFTFEWTTDDQGTAVPSITRSGTTGNLSMALLKKADVTASDSDIIALTATVTMNDYLKHLIHAQGTTITFAADTMALVPLQTGSKFVFFSRMAAVNTATLTSLTDDVTLTYTFPIAELPNIDANGGLYLDLTYYPFGDAAGATTSGARKWYIRNGLNYNHIDNDGVTNPDLDGDPSGGAIFVIIGDGSDDTSTMTEIEMGF